MKKAIALVSCIAFVAVMSLGVNAQEPEKKTTKAKTECCSKTTKKACGAKEAKECKGEKKAEGKKEEKK